jgi:L-alanine-DL-glutamate epimerase-like enolase superfamily enzyme
MSKIDIPKQWRVERIEWAMLPGRRPREAGCNARLGVHGQNVAARIGRVTIGGVSGFGWTRVGREQAEAWIGRSASELFDEEGKVQREFRGFEYPLLDWLGRVAGKPVFRLFGSADASSQSPVDVPCYDTTLYFDDLHLSDTGAAVDLLKREAAEGLALGHRHFKIKVGRGARWMEHADGLARDIAIIHGVRETIGANGRIMIDANNGYTLNGTKEVLAATAGARLYWLEEAFHEDKILYEDLRQWMAKEGLNALIADGEGQASPSLVEWAEQGVIDVVQYDIFGYGFCAWIELGRKLDASHVKSAPHSYGNVFGNYASGHLAAAIAGYQFVEWDPVAVEGLDDSAYAVRDGIVRLPETPGFGLQLDDGYFARKREETGWLVGK